MSGVCTEVIGYRWHRKANRFGFRCSWIRYPSLLIRQGIVKAHSQWRAAALMQHWWSDQVLGWIFLHLSKSKKLLIEKNRKVESKMIPPDLLRYNAQHGCTHTALTLVRSFSVTFILLRKREPQEFSLRFTPWENLNSTDQQIHLERRYDKTMEKWISLSGWVVRAGETAITVRAFSSPQIIAI